MRRCLLFALVACSSSAPAPKETTPAEPIALKTPAPSDAPVTNVAPEPSPAPTKPALAPTGTPTARPCARQSPIVFTVAAETRTHEQLCAIVDDYIMFLGSPSLRAPDLALQLTATLTEGATLSCKISIDVHLRTKLVMTVDGSGSAALGPTTTADAVRDDCMRAVVNDQLGRQIVPALVRAGVTGPASGGAGSAGSP